MATAQMYLKRFYTRVEIRRTNPYLVLATAVYLACKMEECPQHIRLVVSEARSLWPADFIGLDTSKLGECEFYLISEMNSQLIVHQPYRTLTMLQGEFSLSPEEVALAWSVVNDTYMTDLPLLYPPHVIACTAVLLAVVLRPTGGNTTSSNQGGGNNTPTNAQAGLAAATAALNQASRTAASQGNGQYTPLGGTPVSSQGSQPGGFDGSQQQAADKRSAASSQTPDARVGKVQRFAAWLGESGIDIEAMVDSTQELIAFYECHEQYNDKLTREQINRYVKARGLDK
jgi:cyclin C